FPDSAKSEAAKTILDLPRGNNDATLAQDDDPQPDWNPRSYPAPLPQMASAQTLPPDAVRHGGQYAPQRSATPGRGVPSQPQVLTQLAQGSQPLPPVGAQRNTPPPGVLPNVPPNQFNNSPSSSASRPSFPAQGQQGQQAQPGQIPSTKH